MTDNLELPPIQPDLPAGTFAAMVQAGWLLPTDEDAVARIEQQLAGKSIPLPASLRDPGTVLDGQPTGRAHRLALSRPPVDEEPMARAARNARRIDPEIERRMRHDRRQAEEPAGEDATDDGAAEE